MRPITLPLLALTAFLEALKQTTRYEVSGSSLTLYGADTAVARLEAAATPG